MSGKKLLDIYQTIWYNVNTMEKDLFPSSSGLGRYPLTVETQVQILLGTPTKDEGTENA